jgi:hypothetical protein
MSPESSTQASGAPLLTCTDGANRAFRFRCWSSPEAAGTGDEKVQLARWRTTVPVRVQCDIAPFPDSSSPAPRPGVPPRDDQPLQYLERRHRADHGRLNHPSGPDRPSSTMHWMISSTRRTEQVDNARLRSKPSAERPYPPEQRKPHSRSADGGFCPYLGCTPDRSSCAASNRCLLRSFFKAASEGAAEGSTGFGGRVGPAARRGLR